MATGIVKFFDTAKGFGFIQPALGGSDVFVHITAIRGAGLEALKEGQSVSYDLVTEHGRPAAANLSMKVTSANEK